MAKFSDVNNIPATGAEAVFQWKELMKSAGGTIPRSSDGSTFNAAGDEISSGGAGAGGMANSLAWFDIILLDGRQYSVQRDTVNNTTWRIKLSPLDGFGGGTPGITEVSSAPDEIIVLGSGTDAAPTQGTLFPNDGLYRWNIITRDDLTGPAGNQVMPFWAFAIITGTGALETMWFQEPMDPNTVAPLVGTRAVPVTGDPDPVVYEIKRTNNNNIMSVSQGISHGWADTASGTKRYVFGMNGVNGLVEAFVQAHSGSWTVGDNSPLVTFTRNMGSNPYDDADEGFPLLVGRPSAGFGTQIGTKGYCRYLRVRGSATRTYPDTINLATDAYVYLEDCLVPWEDGTAPLV